MSDRPNLRRWLIDSSSPAKLAGLLVGAILLITASALMLSATSDSGSSELIEIDTPAQP